MATESKDILPPPSYEEATAGSSSQPFPAEDPAALSALILDGPSAASTSMTYELGDLDMEMDSGMDTLAYVDARLLEEAQEHVDGDAGGQCEGFWEASATRLGVNLGSVFVGFVSEEREVGLKIGGLNVGITRG